jgi:hypothetical protein
VQLLGAQMLISTAPLAPFGPTWREVNHLQPPHVALRQGTVDEWQLRRRAGRGGVVTLILAVMPTERNRASITYVDRMGATSSVYAPGFCHGAIVVANGNFFIDEANEKRPLGLLKVDGKTIVRTSRRKSGGFLTINANGAVAVLPRRMAAQAESVRDALESTPVLILGGRDDMRGDQGDQFDRIAVGHTRDGATVIVGAFAQDQQTVSLAEFSKLVLAAAAIKRIMIEALLAMDGGPSAHLWFPGKNVLYGHSGPSYLPSAVCVTPR